MCVDVHMSLVPCNLALCMYGYHLSKVMTLDHYSSSSVGIVGHACVMPGNIIITLSHVILNFFCIKIVCISCVGSCTLIVRHTSATHAVINHAAAIPRLNLPARKPRFLYVQVILIR